MRSPANPEPSTLEPSTPSLDPTPRRVCRVLLSMTGFGEAHRQEGSLAVAIEVRTINNRHFKLTARLGEGYAALEPQIETIVRQRVRRGTVQVSMRVDRLRRPEDFRLHADVLAAYWQQVDQLRQRLGIPSPPALEPLLALPGVVDEHVLDPTDPQADWPTIGLTLAEALDRLSRMREQEGRAMAVDLAANCQAIGTDLARIEARAPLVIQGYRDRLAERVRGLLDEHGVTLAPADLFREVGIFSERSDISEEIVRLRSHLAQFSASLDLPESAGRKLEFVTQEMFREANTIGSKANDVEIARHIIDMKTAVERIREMIQNVE
jgi:uncharacterized protein (TIGR00255 family)